MENLAIMGSLSALAKMAWSRVPLLREDGE